MRQPVKPHHVNGFEILTLAGMALMFCLALGWGNYALAPGGAYGDWTIQGVSYDVRRYLWFFQISPAGWPALFALGAFVGALYAIVGVPVCCIFGAVLFRLRPTSGEWLLRRTALWLTSIIFLIGYVGGVTETIIAGRNPGLP